MSKKVLATTKKYEPTREIVEAADDNFTELYAADVTNAADITAVEDFLVLTEYADNAAAVSGGLAVGDFYQTVGAVKIVTA